MHMADALLSPAVGGAMWAVSAGTIAYSSARVRRELDERMVPLMGVFGAFVFAAQMINFTIPGTGSSGHLGGGLLLAILLGPHAAFLTVASVLVVQALFFADGGLLALGCNMFNLGVIPSFIVYPLVYRKLLGSEPGRARRASAIIISAIAGLQLGAFAVVVETCLSGISALPFTSFLLLMQPIHLAIGAVEGVVTVAVVSFVVQARPELLAAGLEARPSARYPVRTLLLTVLGAAVLLGGVVSWYASDYPDGLEWSIAGVTGHEELGVTERGIFSSLAAIQERMAFLPDYAFRETAENPGATGEEAAAGRIGTSVSGIVGAFLTLAIAGLIGMLLRKRTRRAAGNAVS